MRGFLSRVISDQERGLFAGVLKVFLRMFSFFYEKILKLKDILFPIKSVGLGRPVISVGNITWGGTGKTPFVSMLVQYLRSKGRKPAVLIRGYSTGPSGVSDEAEMLKTELDGIPVGVGADRVRSAQNILSSQDVDVFILDDGFQHRQVKRDLDIVLLDATNPFGNGQLIPRGILREPLTALTRGQIIVLSKVNLADRDLTQIEGKVRELNPAALILRSTQMPEAVVNFVSEEEFPLSILTGQKLVAFCAIGNPAGFEAMLKGLGVEVVKFIAFPDHHEYNAEDVKRLFAFADNNKCSLITTAKDEVKLREFQDMFSAEPCWVLKIKTKVETRSHEFFERIDRLLDR